MSTTGGVAFVEPAVRLAARSELRRRWRIYVLLGILLGVSSGLAIAGFGGARRSDRALASWQRRVDDWDVALVPNDPTFGPQQHLAASQVPGIERAEPFSIAFVTVVVDGVEQSAFWPGLIPTPEAGLAVRPTQAPLVAGRRVNPDDPGEIEIDSAAHQAYGVDVGEVIMLRDGAHSVDYPMTVVGITRAPEIPDQGGSWTPSPAFISAHPEIDKITNLALWLEPGADEATVVDAAAKAVGRDAIPTISLSADIRGLYETVRFEATATRLWAVAIALAGVALVGQAIVRTVAAAGYDQRVLGDLGLDRSRRLAALCLPVGMLIVVAVPVAIVGEFLASTWFPIGVARGYALDLGRSLDVAATLLGLMAMVVVAMTAAVGGGVRATRVSTGRSARTGWMAGHAFRAPLPLTARIGLRFAVEPGRGARAVPVRSTLCGVGLGIVGVVAAFTFRAGLDDLLRDPARVGWLGELGAQPSNNGERDESTIASLVADDRVEAMAEVNWHRNFLVNGTNISTWTLRERKGIMRSPALAGRLPERTGELALAPDSLDLLGVHIGDTVAVGADRVPVKVVGKVLLPNESHQGYAFGGMMTQEGYAATGSPDRDGSPGEIFGVYMRLAEGAQPDGLIAALGDRGWETQFTTTPSGFDRLGKARFLSLNFSIFLAALALASLAHALVLTVRRRRGELAVLGALGLPRRSLVAVILAQASTIAIGALAIGVPLGVATGRFVCRVVEETYSFLYVAPAAALLCAIVVALTLVAANITALAPGVMARRVSPSLTLRAE